ncbi:MULTISPECIES: cystathionine gamma-synthase family protein [Sphingomonadales]|uniref:Methionine gamma-lyase n=2 Tax=Edaphosphingomonas TaxID=3423724 RepID=A0A2T4I8C6_9SPHN|nr:MULTISPECIES: cystathionine gamma-synthase family protein [Sphingomonas]AGH49864.1 methionine gamma-lyase [Sphingomonas sp. MM-1]MDX3883875.1 cystathionine gamma-synthase family protein [Sphingomonas sp.]OHT18180.1 Methionine gamma-lyase [Sphingomonas haloaromaticamans]PTD27992.1 methionine gamma-lyase [Sphingomonas fennica]
MKDETEADLSGATPRRRPKPDVVELGGRPLKPATLMMGHGYDPMLSEGALKPPIFLTSTFVFENAAAGKRHFEGVTGKRPGGAEGLVYSRFNGPNQEILEDRLGVWEDAEDALTFSSGMAAIATVLLALVKPGDIIVHSAPLYAATETLIGKILGRFGVHWLDFPAGASREEIDAVLGRAQAEGRVALIYLESPANPTNALVDVEAVKASRDALFGTGPDAPPIAIDNTFLGPLWQKPLRHGADLVLYSLTKYAGGHSDLVAGGAVGSKAAIAPIRAMRNTIGTITDPHSAWMLLRSLETLELRMSRAGENAAKVCAYLRDHPKVETVGYLGFLEEGSRQADIYRRHCTGAGSTFSLYLKGGEKESFAFLDALKIAKLAVSLGGTETLASAPAAMTHLSVPDERKLALGITDNLVRISIGVEDADDLVADMEQALKAV